METKLSIINKYSLQKLFAAYSKANNSKNTTMKILPSSNIFIVKTTNSIESIDCLCIEIEKTKKHSSIEALSMFDIDSIMSIYKSMYSLEEDEETLLQAIYRALFYHYIKNGSKLFVVYMPDDSLVSSVAALSNLGVINSSYIALKKELLIGLCFPSELLDNIQPVSSEVLSECSRYFYRNKVKKSIDRLYKKISPNKHNIKSYNLLSYLVRKNLIRSLYQARSISKYNDIPIKKHVQVELYLMDTFMDLITHSILENGYLENDITINVYISEVFRNAMWKAMYYVDEKNLLDTNKLKDLHDLFMKWFVTRSLSKQSS